MSWPRQVGSESCLCVVWWYKRYCQVQTSLGDRVCLHHSTDSLRQEKSGLGILYRAIVFDLNNTIPRDKYHESFHESSSKIQEMLLEV